MKFLVPSIIKYDERQRFFFIKRRKTLAINCAQYVRLTVYQNYRSTVQLHDKSTHAAKHPGSLLKV